MPSSPEITIERGEADHRIKNSLQLVASFLMMEAAKHPRDNACIAALAAAAARVHAIAEAHRLVAGRGHPALVDMEGYLTALGEHLSDAFQTERGPSLEVFVSRVRMPSSHAMAVGLIVTELVLNAFKHAFAGRDGGSIRVTLGPEPFGSSVLTVADDGGGIRDEALYRDDERGLEIVGALARQLGTEALMRSSAEGTVWRMDLTATTEAMAVKHAS